MQSCRRCTHNNAYASYSYAYGTWESICEVLLKPRGFSKTSQIDSHVLITLHKLISQVQNNQFTTKQMDALSTTTKTQWDEHRAAKHIFCNIYCFK